MLFQEINYFIQGWRGFLLGQRRGWHAHHRGNVQGVRSGYLVSRPGLQLIQLRRVSSFVVEVLSRGGKIWGFGFPGRGGAKEGILWWPRWAPGTLSNSFFARASRVHLVKRLRRLIILRPRRRKIAKRRLWSRPVKIWGQHRRKGTFPLSNLKQKPLRRVLQKLYLRAALLQGIRTFQMGGWWPDLVPRGGKWPISLRHRRPGHFPPRGGWRLWDTKRVKEAFTRSIRADQLRRTRRPQDTFLTNWSSGVTLAKRFSKTTPAGVVLPTRGVLKGRRRRRPGLVHLRRWRSNPGLPTVVVLTEFKGAGTLYREASRAGVPLVVVGSTQVNPVVSICPLWWNPTAVEGPRRLLNQLTGLAQRTGLFTLLWSRLSCLAEW